MLNSYKELKIWQKSIQLVEEIYILTNEFPKNEQYGLSSQMRRAAISIPSNIAEGQRRKDLPEYLQFLRIADSSSAELETQIIIAKKIYSLLNYKKVDELLDEIQRMFNVLIRKLREKNLKPKTQNLKPNSGQILTELIIAIAITVVLAAIGAQLVGVSLYSAGSSKDRQAASRLAEEVFESLRGITQGNTSSTQGWNRIYLPPDGSGTSSSSKGISNLYKIIISGNTWQIASGTEAIVLDGDIYNRSLIIENISRSSSTNAIESNYNFNNDDPHTQKITVTISKTGAPDFVLSQYFTRYLNESTAQINWSGAASCGPVGATSTQSIYCSQSCTDRTTGIKLIFGSCP